MNFCCLRQCVGIGYCSLSKLIYPESTLHTCLLGVTSFSPSIYKIQMRLTLSLSLIHGCMNLDWLIMEAQAFGQCFCYRNGHITQMRHNPRRLRGTTIKNPFYVAIAHRSDHCIYKQSYFLKLGL